MKVNLEKFYIHIPADMFMEYAEKALVEKINIDLYPRVGFIDQIGMGKIREFRDRFFENGLRFSVHAPFIDISPGSPDPRIVEVAEYRIISALQFAHFLGAEVMVCHSGSEVLKYGFPYDRFMENSIKFWGEIKYNAEDLGIRIAIENTIEKKPVLQSELVCGVNSPFIGYCFDIGHWNMEAKVPVTDWLDAFGEKLFAAHLHDNFGKDDDHLAIGSGNIDFNPLTEFVLKNQVETIFVVENKDEENVLKTLGVLRRGDFFSDLTK